MGIPITGEVNSYLDERYHKYLQFRKREEMGHDFGYLNIVNLIEHEYYEPRANGETHHNISWLLTSENILNIESPLARDIILS